tara:strand:+ start:24261 stop:24740 length:480 start_codon:yes stop_codon:yes gene_type:complete
MFGKFGFVLLLGLQLVSCAKPKYVQDESIANQNKIAQEENKVDCSILFSESKYCLSWFWETKPTASQPGSLIFKIFRQNQFDQTPVELDMAQVPEVILWMPGMGHGSSPTQTTRLDVGTYRASKVFFIMPGEWEIRFSVKENGQPNSKPIDGAVVAITI